jgi:hypothetical protein
MNTYTFNINSPVAKKIVIEAENLQLALVELRRQIKELGE